jgi:23S rRNA (uracil1939-C5)-methyltransferase
MGFYFSEREVKRRIRRLLAEYTERKERQARCRHARECKGCSFLELEYDTQLEMKSRLIKSIFATLWEEDIEVQASPKEFFYRNKIELSYIKNILGFRRNWRETFQLKECLLFSEDSPTIVSCVANKLKEYSIVSYEPVKKQGYLRYVVVREGKHTKQRMLSLVTFSKKHAAELERLALELKDCVHASSIVWMLNDTLSDSAFGTLVQSWGNPWIEEEFLGLKLRISHNAFFQPNVFAAELAIKDITSRVKELAPATAFDLFCGIGTIALSVAKHCEKIIGVELSQEAVGLARENAALNRIQNAEFVESKVRSFLKYTKDRPEVVVLDPNRAGLSKKSVGRLLSLAPETIIYLSCNPGSQARDISMLTDAYRIASVKGFDFFPQTPHVECLAILERKSKRA